MAKLADEIAKQSALVDEKLNHADLSLQQARTVADLAYVVAVQCNALSSLVARLEGLDRSGERSAPLDRVQRKFYRGRGPLAVHRGCRTTIGRHRIRQASLEQAFL